MATPAELISAIGAATGVPLATLVDIDRRLVTKGLRTKGGRGLNAANVTSLDAARLLTALLGNPQATKSVETVQRYAKAIIDPARSTSSTYKATGIAGLIARPDHHGFVDALAALISAAGIWANAEKRKPSKGPKIEVFAFTRATYGRIRLTNLDGETSVTIEYLPAATRRRMKDGTGDLEQSRRITELTIFAIANLLNLET